jgi:hypothetical protein
LVLEQQAVETPPRRERFPPRSSAVKAKLKIVCLALVSGFLYTAPLAAAEDPARDNISFTIQYFDKRIYVVEADPVYVRISITNNSPAAYRFKLADERAFSLDFDVRTMNNRALEPAEALIRKRTQNQRIFFREILVESGETFSFVEDLRNYVNLSRPGSFIVRASVYPELYRQQGVRPVEAGTPGNETPVSAIPVVLQSNRLNLNIRPPAIPGPDGIPLAMDVETNAILVREKLAPDEMVEFVISARQKSQWEKFFLYLDLEAMLSRDAVRRRQWLAEGEEGRRQILERYRRELESAVTDGDIAAIPTEFTVERTEYNNLEGTVTVLEKFRTGNYTERKRYTYYVSRKDDIWTIVDYSVINLGTE